VEEADLGPEMMMEEFERALLEIGIEVGKG